VPYLEMLERHDIEQVGGAGRANRGIPADAHPEIVAAARGVFGLGADRATRLGPTKQGETALVMASLHGPARLELRSPQRASSRAHRCQGREIESSARRRTAPLHLDAAKRVRR
jgi:hypothetical protein